MLSSNLSQKKSHFSSFALRYISALIFFAVLGLGLSSFSPNAQAQDTGWELNVGVGYGSWTVIYNPGVSFMASAGYRFTDWFSLNLEQTFLVLSPLGIYDDDHESGDNWYSLYETVLTTKFIWMNDARNFELYFKLGAGIAYYFGHERPVLWSIPTGIGLNYFFTEKMGLGLDVQYDWIFEFGIFKAGVHLAVRF